MKEIFRNKDKFFLAAFIPMTAWTFLNEYFTPLSVFATALGVGYIGWKIGRKE